MNEPFIKRVRLRNYKSIDTCDVRLGRLTMLVGRNGSGKSNFLDALRFVADGLKESLDHAIKSRGGIDEVRRRSTGHPHNVEFRIEFDIDEWKTAKYGFEVAAQARGGYAVKWEALSVFDPGGIVEAQYVVENGRVTKGTIANPPVAAFDRLYLVTASGLQEFRGAFDALTAMGFYSLNPEAMKDFQSPDSGEILRRDGSNIASVVAHLKDEQPATIDRVKEYVQKIVPDILDFERRPFANRETLEFRQAVKGSKHPWRFYAASMSDGTLRVLGALVAVMQLVGRERPVRLVGIEEPETALHPAAAAALIDALREATAHTQVLFTTHSPDLLDQFDPECDTLLVVKSNEGTTEIGPADAASLAAIQDHLYTAGDLLRMDQLVPDRRSLEEQLTLSLSLDSAGE